MKAKQKALHSDLRSRIKTLSVRTAALKRKMLAAGGSHRISRLAQAEDYEGLLDSLMASTEAHHGVDQNMLKHVDS